VCVWTDIICQWRTGHELPKSCSFSWKPFSKLRSVTCHMGSHGVTCHPTGEHALDRNRRQAGRYPIYLPRRLSWPWWLVIYRDGLPVRRQSPIQVVDTRLRPNRQSNSRPFDRKPNVLTVTPTTRTCLRTITVQSGMALIVSGVHMTVQHCWCYCCNGGSMSGQDEWMPAVGYTIGQQASALCCCCCCCAAQWQILASLMLA